MRSVPSVDPSDPIRTSRTCAPDPSWAKTSAIRSAMASASLWAAIATVRVGGGSVGCGRHGATRAMRATTSG